MSESGPSGYPIVVLNVRKWPFRLSDHCRKCPKVALPAIRSLSIMSESGPSGYPIFHQKC